MQFFFLSANQILTDENEVDEKEVDENEPIELRRVQTNKAKSTDQGIVVQFSSCQIKMC